MEYLGTLLVKSQETPQSIIISQKENWSVICAKGKGAEK